MLPPGHFGQALGDMGPLRIELARAVKGSSRLGKLPRRKARIPVGKGVKRHALWGNALCGA
jgi:hypothetical protein